MKNLVAFFEIPCTDFQRTVKFYEELFEITLTVMDCESEKMAFFPEENGICPGSVSWTPDFKPSSDGVLISLNCQNMEKALSIIEKNGGKVKIPKTKIEADGRGYFSVFTDCEGNSLGLYSDK